MGKCCDCQKDVPGQWICSKCAEIYRSYGGIFAVLNRLTGLVLGTEEYHDFFNIHKDEKEG